ncbi:arsenate reductase/protein-tyrosine-phosphatase family protein [Pontibacter beigongshangensis]|uniref:arsenate reductase/protein-tyrosine-phosphatase family protein n=1 Tax=Pontibacter beigongshangensis TaxID=2574733 RepID=UPI00164F6C4A|nr:protein-tyrosine-phosphatase [Pontibacter beigongshangensis]
MLLTALHHTIQQLEQDFAAIPPARKELLQQLTAYIRQKKECQEIVKLIFICTHNSRRSHMAQLWAQAAASYYNIPDVQCYSGGTETTAFNPRAVMAMQEAGFGIQSRQDGSNPVYVVSFADEEAPVEVWSKKFDDAANPAAGFCAIMTCSDADENCPFVPGVESRISITYDDPKNFDGNPQEEEKYRERARQIGAEMLYIFSEV